jgi:hypothetical protein
MRSRGWLDRSFDYTCDEPPFGCSFNDVATRAAIVHASAPELRTMVTGDIIGQLPTLGGMMDILCPIITDVNPLSPDQSRRPTYANWLSGAPTERRLWWYFSCWPSTDCVDKGGPPANWPNYIIDGPAINHRVMGWLSYTYAIDTELYNDVAYGFSHGDPWAGFYFAGSNGDSTLLYPGTPARIGGTKDIPLASIRMKLIREAREDYEYLHMLAAAGDPTLAMKLAIEVAAKTWQFTSDPAVLYSARRRAAHRILELTGGAKPTDPADPSDPNPGPSDSAGGGGGCAATPAGRR